MARVFAVAAAAQQPFAAATIETLIHLLAAVNHRFVVTRYGVGSEGVSNTDQPALMELLRQTTAPTGDVLTLVHKRGAHPDTIETTGVDVITVEPTAGDILRTHTLHPQANIDLADNFTEEHEVEPTGRIGLRLTFVKAQTVSGYIDIEE